MLKRLNVHAWINALAQRWTKAPALSFMLFFGLCAGAAYAIASERSPSPQSASAALVASSAARASSDALAPANAKPSGDAELSDRIKTLEERERVAYMAVLDGQRKSIDWWFSFLAIFTTLVGVGGALIPYLLNHKEKEILALEIASVKRAREDIERSRDKAKADADATKTHLQDAQDSAQRAKDLLKNSTASKDIKEADIEQLKKAAQQVLASPDSEPIEKYRAQATEAEQQQDAELAALLWSRVLDLEPTDANAAFNHAYWLQDKFDKSKDTSVTDWQSVYAAYAKALAINPDLHEAANNWGSALDDEAKALSERGEQPQAQEKWREAGEKYAQALCIKPDLHEAAYNWGIALSAEAKALSETGELQKAQEKWRKAGEKYARALRIKPDKQKAAYNWGNALADEAKALSEKGELLQAQKKWREAEEKYAQALRIKPDYHEAADNWGVALATEAQALNDDGNLSAAQAKWQAAGQKYDQTLRINRNCYEAANNWGSALDAEALALKNTGNTNAALAKRQEADEKYALARLIQGHN